MSSRMVVFTDQREIAVDAIPKPRDELVESIAETLNKPGSVLAVVDPNGVTIVPVRAIQCVRIESET